MGMCKNVCYGWLCPKFLGYKGGGDGGIVVKGNMAFLPQGERNRFQLATTFSCYLQSAGPILPPIASGLIASSKVLCTFRQRAIYVLGKCPTVSVPYIINFNFMVFFKKILLVSWNLTV